MQVKKLPTPRWRCWTNIVLVEGRTDRQRGQRADAPRQRAAEAVAVPVGLLQPRELRGREGVREGARERAEVAVVPERHRRAAARVGTRPCADIGTRSNGRFMLEETVHPAG